MIRNFGSVQGLKGQPQGLLLGLGTGGNALPSDVLNGKKFTNDNGEQVGTGDNNLTVSNIKRGVTIFGVTGTYEPNVLTAGTDTIIYNDTKATTSAYTNDVVKVREYAVNFSGTIRTSIALYCSQNNAGPWAAIYINGIKRGTTRKPASTSQTIYTEDITVQAGDLVQLYYSGWTNESNWASISCNTFKLSIANLVFGTGNL